MNNALSAEGLYINDFHRENSMVAQRETPFGRICNPTEVNISICNSKKTNNELWQQ